jgi:hypothetical protein
MNFIKNGKLERQQEHMQGFEAVQRCCTDMKMWVKLRSISDTVIYEIHLPIKRLCSDLLHSL